MANEEERLLETQIELQLYEQKESLSAIQDALTFDSLNSELLSVILFSILQFNYHYVLLLGLI